MASAEELAVRRAVRSELAGLPPEQVVLVACSGGADSLALAAAGAYLRDRDGRPVGAVTVDHGLQSGSAERARALAASLADLGLDPVEVVRVQVPRGGHGPEGNARDVRYAALDDVAEKHSAAAVLLGHTRDDQAETVLLGLTRGSGARSLAGMPAVSGRYRRPLLGLPRAIVRAAVPAEIKSWDDPHNADPGYARARVRHRVLPMLEEQLGPGITSALSRTADLLRADADALDGWAERVLSDARSAVGGTVLVPEHNQSHPDHEVQKAVVSLDLGVLTDVPQAVRSRVLRGAAIAAGSSSTDLTAAHIASVDALVTRWRGQRGIDLPGKVHAARRGQALHFSD